MDNATVLFHQNEMDTQPSIYKSRSLNNLFPDELLAFDLLASCNGRIEQERLQQAYTINILSFI